MSATTQSRIPDWEDRSFDGMLKWFSELSVRDLLFHPDDDPGDLVDIGTGKLIFSRAEARHLRGTVAEMFDQHGDQVYEAAYPIFMNKMGIRLDA